MSVPPPRWLESAVLGRLLRWIRRCISIDRDPDRAQKAGAKRYWDAAVAADQRRRGVPAKRPNGK